MTNEKIIERLLYMLFERDRKVIDENHIKGCMKVIKKLNEKCNIIICDKCPEKTVYNGEYCSLCIFNMKNH